MITLFFVATYGVPLSMIVFAWVMEPKKTNTNSGVRL